MLIGVTWSKLNGSEAQLECGVQEWTRLLEEGQSEAAANLTHNYSC